MSLTARKTPARKVRATWRYMKQGEILRLGDVFIPRSKPASHYWMPTLRVGEHVGKIESEFRCYRRILKAKRKTRGDAR